MNKNPFKKETALQKSTEAESNQNSLDFLAMLE